MCTAAGLTRCSGSLQCGDDDNRADGLCDKDGCDFNSFRMGDQTFLGPGKTVDTNSKFTVVTQFLAPEGTLTEIRRLYVQNGKVIQNSLTRIPAISPAVNSITDGFCNAQKAAFGDANSFGTHGGLAAMGAALARGMVLVMSIWDDHAAGMYWLDSVYPTDANPAQPGTLRGPCSNTTGDPTTVEATEAANSVTFSNIKWGAINSTFGTTSSSSPPASSSPPSSTASTTPPSNPTGGSIPFWDQCGGQTWPGSGTCVAGSTCIVLNPCESAALLNC